MRNFTTEQLEHILIDAGVVYVNYGLPNERVLAPTRGGNSFTVNQVIRDVDFDGRKGKTKGLRRVVEEDAMLKVNLLDMSQENVKLALPGSKLDAGTNSITSGNTNNYNLDYVDNIALVGEALGGGNKVIILYNGLSDGGLEVAMKDKDESSVELSLSAHYDPADMESPIYKIDDVNVTDINTVTFTVETNVNAPIVGASVVFNGQTKVTDNAGIAIFNDIPDGVNLPFSVFKSGYEAFIGSVDVSADTDVSVTLVAQA